MIRRHSDGLTTGQQMPSAEVKSRQASAHKRIIVLHVALRMKGRYVNILYDQCDESKSKLRESIDLGGRRSEGKIGGRGLTSKFKSQPGFELQVQRD